MLSGLTFLKTKLLFFVKYIIVSKMELFFHLFFRHFFKFSSHYFSLFFISYIFFPELFLLFSRHLYQFQGQTLNKKVHDDKKRTAKIN